MEQEEKKDGDYALNTFKDIRKYDPARLLDLGNFFQVLISQNKPEINEERRASSNFEKLTEDKPRPIEHTLVDATRLLPDIIALAGPTLLKAGAKAFVKGATKKATKGVAKKLVNEGTSDAAKALSKSKFLPRDEKVMTGKKWVRDLLENKDAMERVAGKKLSDKEVEAIRKNIKEFVPHKIDTYNADVDKLKDVLKRLNIKEKFDTKDDLVKYLSTNKKSLGLTDTEYKNLIKNIDVLPDARISHAHLNPGRIEDLKEGKNVLENISELKPGRIHSGVLGVDAAGKVADAGINKAGKINFQTNKELEIKPDYFARGSMPTPVSDFIASMFNVDFNDPARFNKKDIDTFFDFLEDAGYIEPGIKDKWTPRQKVSVMREILSDKTINERVKEKWAESKYKENLNEYYNNRGE